MKERAIYGIKARRPGENPVKRLFILDNPPKKAGADMNFEHVAGLDKGKITLYALSTCVWCKKTKELLSSLGVAFDYVYVDLLKGADRQEAIDQVKRYNPGSSFPTLVIGESKCIVGFREKDIKEALQ
jgi:glutaredoxin